MRTPGSCFACRCRPSDRTRRPVPKPSAPAPVRIRELHAPTDHAFDPAYRLLRRAFPPAELLPRRSWVHVLHEREAGVWTDLNWHLFVAERGRALIGAASGTYLGNVNVGLIGYIVVRGDVRSLGLGLRLRWALRLAFERDARRVRGRPLRRSSVRYGPTTRGCAGWWRARAPSRSTSPITNRLCGGAAARSRWYCTTSPSGAREPPCPPTRCAVSCTPSGAARIASPSRWRTRPSPACCARSPAGAASDSGRSTQRPGAMRTWPRRVAAPREPFAR